MIEIKFSMHINSSVQTMGNTWRIIMAMKTTKNVTGILPMVELFRRVYFAGWGQL
jgi:hypothetical protein